MIFSFTKNNKVYKFDSTGGIDISIPLDFYGAQPRAYGVEKASAKAYISDNFVGDIRRGGSCNFEKYTLIPHCNGTHTECIGHISDDRIFINETLKDTLVPSSLITVIPVNALSSDDSYLAGKEKDDLLIDKKSLMELTKSDRDFLEGLIIRTLPNDESKKYRDYMKEPAPFFLRKLWNSSHRSESIICLWIFPQLIKPMIKDNYQRTIYSGVFRRAVIKLI